MEENRVDRPIKTRKSKIILSIVIALAVVVSFVGGYFSYYLINKKSVTVAADIARIMQEVGYIVDPETGEIREITEEEIAYALVNAFLDEYSAYYTAEEYQALKRKDKGENVGVGLAFLGNSLNVYDVVEDYFALASSDHCPILIDFTLK